MPHDGPPRSPDPSDEGRHVPDGDDPLWNESFYFDWFAEDLSAGGYVRLGLQPNQQTAWYWACLVRPGRPLVTVIEHDAAVPRSPSSLEVRHDGLWADHAIEDPLEHVSINLESFALALDDPAEVYRDPRGERVPFGFELDLFTDRAAYLWPPLTPRYEIPCRVHGHILVGTERIQVDGWGQRDHSWGAARDWWAMGWNWTAGRLADGTRWHSLGGLSGGGDWGVAYELPPGSSQLTHTDTVRVECELGADGLPVRTSVAFGDLDLDLVPVAHSPVLLTSADGREARFPRTLCRVTSADGREGGAWMEWNQPPTS